MDWANRHGSLPAFAMAARLRAYAWWRRGSLAEAEADATSALEHAELPGFPPYGYGALANVLLARGKTAEADAILRRPLRAREQPGGLLLPAGAGPAARGNAAPGRRARGSVRMRAARAGVGDPHAGVLHLARRRGALLGSLDRRDEALRLAREELDRCRAFGAAGSARRRAAHARRPRVRRRGHRAARAGSRRPRSLPGPARARARAARAGRRVTARGPARRRARAAAPGARAGARLWRRRRRDAGARRARRCRRPPSPRPDREPQRR